MKLSTAITVTIDKIRRALHKGQIHSLRQLAQAIGVHRETLRRAVKRDPELARLTAHITRWNGARGDKTIESRIATIEEAKRAGKVRYIRDALIISGIHWQAHKRYVKKYEGWQRVMANVPFSDVHPARLGFATGHRAHVLYTNFVRENEANGIPQPEASWRAVDRAADEVEKRRAKNAAELRKRKWGDAAWDVQKKKKRRYFTKKDAERVAKTALAHMQTYLTLQSLAMRSGKTVEEVAAEGRTAGERKRYFAAIAEARDKKSVKEAAARTDAARKERAEREARAAKVRKRPDLVRGARRPSL